MTDLIRYRLPARMPGHADGPGWVTLQVREGTSDVDVIEEVFVQDVYHLRGITLEGALIPETGDHRAPVIVDVGACTGIFTALCCQLFPDATVIAVEPETANFDLLTVNTFKWNSRVTRHRAMVGATGGHAALEGSHGTAHAAPDDDGPAPGEQMVEQFPLAQIVDAPCALLKMDIEGGEYDAIDACPEETLGLVDTIVMEWHGTREAPWVADAPGRYARMVAKLACTHSIQTFGRPDQGGMLYAHRYDQ